MSIRVRGNQLQRRDRIKVAGHVFKAVLAASAVALMSAWLVLPSPAMAQTQFTLTVTLAGGGTGSVHDTNFNISCPTDCSAAFDQGAEVELVASPTAARRSSAGAAPAARVRNRAS